MEVNAEHQKYLKIYQRYFNSKDKCPYCDEKGDPHQEDCFLLDIIAYIEEGVPLPLAAVEPPATLAADAGDVRPAVDWQQIEADYRETCTRLHGIAAKHKLPTPPGEDVDVTIEREFDKANARIAALETELVRARAALEPFAIMAGAVERHPPFRATNEMVIFSWAGYSIIIGQLNAAADALGKPTAKASEGEG